MFDWLERERIRRHLETIQETSRFLLSNCVSEKEVVLRREDDNIFISIPNHFVTDVDVNESEHTITLSGCVYGKRGVQLLEDFAKLKKDQTFIKKHFLLMIPHGFEGIVRFEDKKPTTRQRGELVYFKIPVYILTTVYKLKKEMEKTKP